MSDIQPVNGGLARGLQHTWRVTRYRRTGASPRPRTRDHVHTPPCTRPRARTGERERTSGYPSIRAHTRAHTNTHEHARARADAQTRGRTPKHAGVERTNRRALSGRTGTSRGVCLSASRGMGVRARASGGPAGSFNPSSDLPTIGAQIILTVLLPDSPQFEHR